MSFAQVVTLTKPELRPFSLTPPPDEQLHVLPHYIAAPTDEFGSYQGHAEKIRSGALNVLDK